MASNLRDSLIHELTVVPAVSPDLTAEIANREGQNNIEPSQSTEPTASRVRDVAFLKKRLARTSRLRQGCVVTAPNPQDRVGDCSPIVSASLPFANLAEATRALRGALDSCLLCLEQNGDLSTCSDEYTKAARSFAAIVLAKRISDLVSKVPIDPKTSCPDFGFSEKVDLSRQVRFMLAPWNLGLADGVNQTKYQLMSQSSGSKRGVFVLRRFGSPGSSESIRSWPAIAKILGSPHLCDVTKESRER
jgi:hypothetical protein